MDCAVDADGAGATTSLTWDSLLRLDVVTGPNSGSTDTDLTF